MCHSRSSQGLLGRPDLQHLRRTHLRCRHRRQARQLGNRRRHHLGNHRRGLCSILRHQRVGQNFPLVGPAPPRHMANSKGLGSRSRVQLRVRLQTRGLVGHP